MTYRPLTSDHKVDLGQVAPPADRSFAVLLPATPDVAAVPAAAAAPPRPRVSSRAQLAGAIVVGLLVLLAAVFLAQNVPPPAARVVDPPTAAPARSTAAAGAVAPAATQPQVALDLATLTRPVGAFAAPDGAYLGILEAGRAYTPTARLGDAWTQITAAGSGRVWVKAVELSPSAELPDLATPTARPLPTAAPAPVVIVKEIPAAPEPTQCASVAGGGTQIQRCGTAPIEQLEADALAAWRAQFGGNVAPVATMTPYGGKP